MLSAGGLLLEISLTRLFSTLFYPPYVFAILSLAVLGIGLGAAAATWRPRWRRPAHLPLYLSMAAAASVVLTLFAVETAAINLQVPLLILLVTPYAFIGLALATFFSADFGASPQLYLADLGGGGLGALMAIPILNVLGGINGCLVAAVLLGAASLVLKPSPLRRAPGVVAIVPLVLLLSQLGFGWITLNMATLASDKPIKASLASSGRILQTEWNAFARTDLVDPADGGPYRLYMDGAAGSVMPPSQDNAYLRSDIGLLPFAIAQPRRVFVIGPGGGLDVWFGLQVEAEEIVAVEVNPASVRLVDRFGGYNGDLYRQPSVRVVIDEGRSVLRREGATYDLIFLSQVVTLTAERSGFALTENTVFTVEAFQEYLRHLNEGGQIAIKLYDEPTLTRALATAVAALRADGLSDAEALRHTAAFLDPRPQSPVPLLLLGESAFTIEDSLEMAQVARRVGFVPLYLPELWAGPPLDAVEAGSVGFDEIIAGAGADISPTSDDRPFFYQFEHGLPGRLQWLLLGLAGLVAVGGVLLVLHRRHRGMGFTRWSPLYFACLGAGFIGIEVVLIQQIRGFLGHPTLAVTAVVAVLLLGGGIGSGLAGRWFSGGGHSIPPWPTAAVAGLTFVWLVAWTPIAQAFLAASTPIRLLVVVMSLLPLALSMGMPFPLGLRVAGLGGDGEVALAWAVNGVMTVVGSAGAVSLAIVAGFSRVLVVGILVYMLAAAVAWWVRPIAHKG